MEGKKDKNRVVDAMFMYEVLQKQKVTQRIRKQINHHILKCVNMQII